MDEHYVCDRCGDDSVYPPAVKGRRSPKLSHGPLCGVRCVRDCALGAIITVILQIVMSRQYLFGSAKFAYYITPYLYIACLASRASPRKPCTVFIVHLSRNVEYSTVPCTVLAAPATSRPVLKLLLSNNMRETGISHASTTGSSPML